MSAGPDTAPDRDVTLNAVSRGKAVPIKEIYDELQVWKFSLTRLATLGVTPPDASVQIKALCKTVEKIVQEKEEVKHRYFGVLVQKNLNSGSVSQAQVDELWRYLSAESREFAESVDKTADSEESKKAKKAEAAALAAALAAKSGGGKGGPKGGKPDTKGGKGDPQG